MQKRQPGLALIVLFCLATFATSVMAQEPAKTFETAKPTPVTSRDKPAENFKPLAPQEAAKACLITADEMARNGYRHEAILLYERARQLDPKQKQICRYLAVLYDEDGADDLARAEYHQALQQSPKDPDLLNDLGYFYYSRGDMEQAEHNFRAAIAQSPHHERAWINLGLTLGQEQRYQDSFEAFSKVISPAAANSNVGMILAQQGHRQEAKTAFQRALSLEPNLKQPRALLAYLDSPTPGANPAASTSLASPNSTPR